MSRRCFAALGALIVIAGVIFGLTRGSGGPAVRSDEAMLATLREHHADLDHLVTMLSEDRGLVAVDFDWTDPVDPASMGVSPDRIQQYRTIFNRVGLRRGARVRESANQGFRFVFIDRSAGGLVNGLSKSFVRSQGEVLPVVSELDSLLGTGTKGASYRFTGTPFWYLLLDRS